MMNYEELYEALSASEKELNDTVKAAANQTKALIKNTEAGNITELRKTANIFLDTAARLQELGRTLSDTADAFDTKAYFAGGDFSRQMVEACLSLGIDVQGENGVYEMFPFKVRVIGDEEHDGEVYLNRKKLPTCRPSRVAGIVKDNQDKLNRANFNSTAFMNELADAYETTCLKTKNSMAELMTGPQASQKQNFSAIGLCSRRGKSKFC